MPDCRKCGAEFTASRTGSTVNCPACRGAPKRASVRSDLRHRKADPGQTCTVKVSAVTGEVCGKPAVVTFNGGKFAECRACAPKFALAEVGIV